MAAGRSSVASQYGLGTFERRDAIRGFFEDWIGAYEQIEDETEEILDVGNGAGLSGGHAARPSRWAARVRFTCGLRVSPNGWRA